MMIMKMMVKVRLVIVILYIMFIVLFSFNFVVLLKLVEFGNIVKLYYLKNMGERKI